MNKKVKDILDQIAILEEELLRELKEHDIMAFYQFKGEKIHFEKNIKDAHKRMKMGILSWLHKSKPQHFISVPFIYIMLIPLVILDIFISLYQAICFRLYGIPAVKRSKYIVFDRHHLKYLNIIERINCDFCGYANGLIAYVSEIAARTEQYWCPIKHARKNLIHHKRYPYFIEYGDANDLHARIAKFRAALKKTIEEEESKISN